jgi:hypothetical protein
VTEGQKTEKDMEINNMEGNTQIRSGSVGCGLHLLDRKETKQ